jgi:plastocyanin
MKAWLVTSAILVTGLVAMSCGGGGGSSDPSPTPNQTTIRILGQRGNQSFSPNPADVGGRAVVFRNDDSVVHRVVLNDGSIDTGDIAPGATSRIINMPSSGTNYHCSIHDNMGGAVNPAAGGDPPPCEGIYCY